MANEEEIHRNKLTGKTYIIDPARFIAESRCRST